MTEELTTFKAGDTVEGYRIMSEIGRGAASIIYLVQDTKSKQIWALKHVEKTDPKAQRFLDQAEIEYKIANQIKHPAVRRIEKMLKKGSLLKCKDLYLVMELVDGISMFEETPTDLPVILDLFHQTASGLHEMHKHGYVHADMKPHNVIIGSDIEGNLTAKIIDLGQSCKIGTIKKRIQGTPDYTNAALHLVHPLAFDIDEKACRRAGLDYWPRVNLTEHDSFPSYQSHLSNTPNPHAHPPRVWYMSARASKSIHQIEPQWGDHFVFGKESAGLDPQILQAHPDQCLSIPIVPSERSLNLSIAVSITLYTCINHHLKANQMQVDQDGRLLHPNEPQKI